MNDTEDLLIGTMDNHKVYLKASEVISLCTEEVRKENEELRSVLSAISFMTPALGGTKSDMQRALLDIDKICRAILDGDDE